MESKTKQNQPSKPTTKTTWVLGIDSINTTETLCCSSKQAAETELDKHKNNRGNRLCQFHLFPFESKLTGKRLFNAAHDYYCQNLLKREFNDSPMVTSTPHSLDEWTKYHEQHYGKISSLIHE